jgi:hypothetical protein
MAFKEFKESLLRFDELRKIEMQIGFTVGILIGALAAYISVLLFTSWAWYFKLFTTIGEIGILGSLLLALNEMLRGRRNYIEAQKEMNRINDESSKIVEENG